MNPPPFPPNFARPSIGPAPATLPPGIPAPVAGQADDGVREVKVKLPVEQILKLHYARMKHRENFSAIVSSALTRYFDEMSSP